MILLALILAMLVLLFMRVPVCAQTKPDLCYSAV